MSNARGIFDTNANYESINRFNIETCSYSVFSHMSQIPIDLIDSWGIVAARILSNLLINTIDTPDTPERATKLNAALRWYCAFPQIYFRTMRNNSRDIAAVKRRLLSFISRESWCFN